MRRIGGPIFQDKLWFFTAHRVFGYQNLLAGNYFNSDAGHAGLHARPEPPGLAPAGQLDRRRPLHLSAVEARTRSPLRGTIQHTDICLGCSPLVAPEATLQDHSTPIRTTCSRASGRASQTNKLFFEVADSTLIFNWPNTAQGRRRRASRSSNSNTGYPLQRAAGLEPRPARRQPVEPAGVGELRHRVARLQGRASRPRKRGTTPGTTTPGLAPGIGDGLICVHVLEQRTEFS